MFSEIIKSTELTDPMSNSYFDNRIVGEPYCCDSSFLSTARALLDKRVEDGEKFIIINYNMNYRRRSDADINYYISGCEYCGITILSISGVPSDITGEFLEKLDNSIAKSDTFSGFSKLEKVTVFYSKAFPVVCYINPEKKSTLLVVLDLDIKKYHFLQCGIVAYLPWYFNPDDGISDMDMELIKSLKESSSEKYLELISKYAKILNFRDEYIKKMLTGFETAADRNRIDYLNEEVKRLIRDVESYSDRIASLIKQKEDFNTSIIGLKNKILEQGEHSELLDYFLANKRLELITTYNDTIVFVVKDYLEYYDEEFVENALNNENSYFFYPNGKNGSRKIPKEDAKLFFKALFLDKTIKMRMCGNYTLTLSGNVNASSGFDYPVSCKNYMQNPHFFFHACLGNYRPAINQMMINNDYIGAIEQCLASARSVNVGESATMDPFIEELYGFRNQMNREVIELPDGRVVDMKTAIEYLKEA